MIDTGLIEELAHWNVELHRRVVELEEQDRVRLSRIATLKLELAELRATGLRTVLRFRDLEIEGERS
jgi:hypothetical protein